MQAKGPQHRGHGEKISMSQLVSQATQPEVTGESNDSRPFSLRERFLLWLISWSAYLLVRLVGSTLRFQITLEEGSLADGARRALPGIYCFWHRAMIPSAYHFRNMQIGIMISRSFDGECIARIVQKLGFRPVRGSSSRGAVAAMVGMRRYLPRMARAGRSTWPNVVRCFWPRRPATRFAVFTWRWSARGP